MLSVDREFRKSKRAESRLLLRPQVGRKIGAAEIDCDFSYAAVLPQAAIAVPEVVYSQLVETPVAGFDHLHIVAR